MEQLKYGELDVLVAATDEELGEAAAEALAISINAALAEKDEIAIIMALGAAQKPFYDAIIARDDIEWSKITVLHVDTYQGVKEAQFESGASRMRRHLLDFVKPKAFFPMQGDHEPIEEELARYSGLLNDLDPILCVVGIGETGHLAFNDPPADFDTRELMDVVVLDEVTRHQVLRNGIFPTLEEVPTHGVTMTMYALLRAPRVLALVHDLEKAAVIKELLEGPVTNMVPASLLQETPQATLYLNQPAASLLTR